MKLVTRIGSAALLACAAGALAPAQAQMGGTQGFKPLGKNHIKPEAPTEAAPPGLPGATSNGGPAERTLVDMAPNEALFDAINRGDIASARDALSRGADMGARNVLGMTPLELSVDLSRNDITFLLLSLRAPDATPLAGQAATAESRAAGGAKAGAGKATAAAKPAAAKPVAAIKPPTAPKPTRQADAPMATPPRQYAGPAAQGTPDPQAGFLGFGSSVQ